MKDKKTASYFDCYTPEYSLERFNFAVSKINQYATENSSLLDIGCGSGNILLHISRKTKIKNLFGLDIIEKYLSQTREKLPCETYQGSIIDCDIISKISSEFDFVLMGAVLHHLVEKTRKKSKELAVTAINNAVGLLKDNGYLIIFEPVFYPAITMDIVFYIKRALSTVTTRRIQVLGHWNNIGAPVVSYFTNEELYSLVEKNINCQIVDKEILDQHLSLLWRMAFITRRTDTTIIAKKIRA
jgi:SAM-dependent methyltransferase